jgi:D-sedoheptulose 7-phosphate isomerase
MDTIQRVEEIFSRSIESIQQAKDMVAEDIARGGELFVRALRDGGKIMACGNGGSAADAQHFSAELLNRFEMERPGLAGLALTTDTSTLTSIANDYRYEDVFAKQVRALGRVGDVLLIISTSGNSVNLLRAAEAAREKGIRCVALNGKDGGRLSQTLLEDDVDIIVPGTSTARIQEVHGIALHCFCDLIDKQLLGQD